MITYHFSTFFILLATKNKDIVCRVVRASTTTNDVFRIKTNFFVCVIHNNAWNVFHGQVWCNHTPQRLHLLCTTHVSYRLTIHCIINFFLRSQITNRVNHDDYVFTTFNLIQLLHDVELQLFNVHDWSMDNSLSINTERVKV